MRSIDQYVKKVLDTFTCPGIAIGVVKDNKVIYSKSIGVKRVSCNDKAKVNIETLFPIGSITKTFISLGIGILVDKGLVKYDDPVKKYIPELKLYNAFLTEEVAIRDILSHRTGIPRYKAMVLANPPKSFKELLERLENFKPVRPIRSEFQYNNATYAILGIVIERVSGKSWSQFIKEYILEPLGMKSTNFGVQDLEDEPNHVNSHRKISGEITEINHLELEACGPAGSMNSNLEDMLKYLKLLLNHGKCGTSQIISEKTLDEMHTPHSLMHNKLPVKEYFYPFYGLGFVTENYRGYKIVQHPGFTSGCITYISYIPSKNIGIVVLSNYADPPVEVLTSGIYDRLLKLSEIDYTTQEMHRALNDKWDNERQISIPDFLEKKSPLLNPLSEYVGVYEHPAMGEISVFIHTDDTLKAKYGIIEMTFTHVYDHSFMVYGNLWGGKIPMKVDFIKQNECINQMNVPLGWDNLIEDFKFVKK